MSKPVPPEKDRMQAGHDARVACRDCAGHARWKEVIQGNLDPIEGMMEGKLTLSRGDLPTIVRFIESSRKLVVSASKVPREFM